MAQVPLVDVTFEDGNLGTTLPGGASLQLKVGPAQTGEIGVPTTFTRLAAVRDTYGAGPLASAVAVALQESKPVLGLRVPSSVPGTKSAVTHVGTGAATATVSGNPADATDVVITITRPAANLASATAAYRAVVGGADLGERALPVSGIVELAGTGLTVTFSNGSFVAGDTYAFTSTAPGTTLADLAAAVETFLAGASQPVRFIHVLGGAGPDLGAAMQVLASEAESRGRYVHIVLDAKPRNAGETAAAYRQRIDTEWLGFVGERVSVAYEGGYVYNPLARRDEVRSAAWPASMRRTRVPIGEDASRVRTGSLSGVSQVTVPLAAGESSRLIGLCVYDGYEGVYCAGWPMMAPAGSDYELVQGREVADAAARAARIAAFEYLGDDVVVDADTGALPETTVSAMEEYIAGRVRAQVGANASRVRVEIDRDTNVISTRALEYDVILTPLGYLREIRVRVAYTNPALQPPTTPTPTDTGAPLPASTPAPAGGKA